MAKLIDVHAHLQDKPFDTDRDSVIVQMEREGICAVMVGTDLQESHKAIALAETYAHLWATVGMHPVDNKEEIFNVDTYRELLMHPKVVALGECGLDYYWPTQDGIDIEAEKVRQKKLFETQITLAIETNKPLMLHGRPSKGSMDAYEDMIEMLHIAKRMHGERVRGNFHFFVGDTAIAQRVIDLGFTVSFSGVITFAKEYEEVVKFVPLTMMHAETDSPYASPLPLRGKRNSPLNVKYIVQKIAEIKGIKEEDVRDQLLKNAQRLFGLTFNP